MKIKNFIIEGLTVESKFLGDKEASFNSGNWNNHKIKLTYNGHSRTFDFWGSIRNPEISTEEELKGAVECILYDATTGHQYDGYDIDTGTQEIINEFGYSDFREARRVFKGVVKTFKNLHSLFKDSNIIYDLHETLIARYSCIVRKN